MTLINIIDFILLILAVDAATTALVRGDIFSSFRAWVKSKNKLAGELVSCAQCAPYHIAAWLTILFWIPLTMLEWDIFRIPLLILACVTVVHFLQGVHPLLTDGEEQEQEVVYMDE